MSFTQFPLDARLQGNIERAGWTTPTPIQTQAIPVLLDGHDLIGTAQTGTGKTAAFVLPMMHRLLTGRRAQGVRALIVTPTRELAEQIHQAIRMLAVGTPLRSATVYGGVSAGPQIRALRAGVDILVACPGRLLDHLGTGFARLDKVEMLVLDEADRMFDMGFMPAVREIITNLPAQRQTMLFSATFPPEIEKLAAGALKAPEKVSIDIERPAHTVSHTLYAVPSHNKTTLLFSLLEREQTKSVLVFTRTKHRAERLAKQLASAGRSATHLHSNRTQSQRQSALDGFRNGAFKIMVATDIAARGIDVDRISHVVNYDMPDTPDAYIHRIGRTGRALRNGQAWTFITHEDTAMVRTLEKIMGERIPRASLPEFDGIDVPAPETSSSQRPPSRGGRAPRHEERARSERPFRSEERAGSERPFRSEERARSERPFKSEERAGSERPFRSEERARSERPIRNGERPQHGSSQNGRPMRSEERARSERPLGNGNAPKADRRFEIYTESGVAKAASAGHDHRPAPASTNAPRSRKNNAIVDPRKKAAYDSMPEWALRATGRLGGARQASTPKGRKSGRA